MNTCGDIRVTRSWIERIAVVAVSGDVDMLTAPALADAIRAAAGDQPSAVIVDLSDVGFLASAGMGVLIDAHDALAPAVRFGVIADGPSTSRPLKLVGIDSLLALYRTRDEALVDLN